MLRNNRKSPHRIITEITSPLDPHSPPKSKNKWIRTRRRSIYCQPIRRKLLSFVILGLLFIGSLNYSKRSRAVPVMEEQIQKYNIRNTIQLEKSPFFSDESIMIPIYYVNLDSSPDRRKDIENDFANFDEDLKAHLELHRVSAVTIDDVKQMLEEKTFLLNNNITLSAPENRHLPDTYKFGEAACTLSHLKAIKQAYDDGVEVAVVIEDDSLLTNDFAKYWRSYAAEAPNDWSILQLITSNPAVNKRDLHKHGDYLITWEPQHWSTVGYTINRKGMKELLDRLYNSQKGQWRLDEPFILVADEVLYYFTSKPYTSTYPWITARDVETTIAMNLGSKRDLTFGQSEARPDLQVSHTRNESIAVVMSCRLGGENEIVNVLDRIKLDMAILAKANPKSFWFVSVVLVDIELKEFLANQIASLSLPKESFYVSVDDKPFNKFTFVSRIKRQLRMFDLVLFKDNHIYLDGFPWNTFMETKQDSIIAAPYRNNVEISLQRKIKLLLHEPNELVNFQDSALFNKYTSASYKNLEGIATTYIENVFVLMDSSFAVWFFDQVEDYMDNEIDYGLDNMWCGAAEEFNRTQSASRTASCILAPVSIHDDNAMRTHKNEEIHKAQLAAMERYEENDTFARWAKKSSKFRPFTRKIQEIHEICQRNGVKKVEDYWSECFSFFMKHEVQRIQSISMDGFAMLTDLFETRPKTVKMNDADISFWVLAFVALSALDITQVDPSSSLSLMALSLLSSVMEVTFIVGTNVGLFVGEDVVGELVGGFEGAREMDDDWFCRWSKSGKMFDQVQNQCQVSNQRNELLKYKLYRSGMGSWSNALCEATYQGKIMVTEAVDNTGRPWEWNDAEQCGELIGKRWIAREVKRKNLLV